MKTLTEKYARHAERFGFEEVWETAKRELPPLELGHLSLRLQRIDRQATERLDDRARRRWKPWKLPQHEARELAEALIRFGVPDRKLAAMATVTTRTVRAWRTDPDSPLVLLADRIGAEPSTLEDAAATFGRPDNGSPIARLERLELLEEIAVAACRAEPDTRVAECLDRFERVVQSPNQPRKPAFQSGEMRKSGPTLGNGSDPAKTTPASAQEPLFEEVPAG